MSLKKFNRKGGHSMGGIPPGSAKSKRDGSSMEIKPAEQDATAVKKPNVPKTFLNSLAVLFTVVIMS